MASIRERTSTSGEVTWAVLFRRGKKQESKTFRDRKKAEKFVLQIAANGADRALRDLLEVARPKGITVDNLATQFLERKARDVTPRTLADYRRDRDNWITPWFGHCEAEEVTETDVQKWVDHMTTKLSPKSVADRHMLLHSIYQYGKAKSRALVSHNPCLETELPKRTKKPPKGTTTPEWRAILKVAATRNPDAGDLILFLGSLGWRWSEAAALPRHAVEDDGEFVWVDVTRVFRMFDNRQIPVEDAAKTYASFRRSRVPSEAAAMFRRRIVGKGPDDYVFTNTRGRHWNQNTFLRDTWPTLVKAAGVGSDARKPTPHWLRHMAVANMARAGIPMHEIQRIIGHDDLATTNKTYGGMVGTLSPAGVYSLDAVLADDPASAVVSGEVLDAQFEHRLAAGVQDAKPEVHPFFRELE